MLDTQHNERLVDASLRIVEFHCHAFRNRFGGNPRPNEPLLFHPELPEPNLPSLADQTIQIVTTSTLCNVAPKLVLTYRGLTNSHLVGLHERFSFAECAGVKWENRLR